MTTSNNLDYEFEYIGVLIQSAPADGLIQWESYFKKSFNDRNLGNCRRLLTLVKSANLGAVGRGMVWLHEGDLHEFTGNTRMAFSSYNSCLNALTTAKITDIDRNKWISEVLGKLAHLEKATGNYVEARRLYNLQLDIYEVEGLKHNKKMILGELADLAIMQEDYQDAIKLLESQLGISRELDALLDQLNIFLKLSLSCQRTGNLDRADMFCEQAIEQALDLNYHSVIVMGFEQRASIRIEQGRHTDAQKAFSAAISNAMEAGDKVKAKEIRERLDKLEKMLAKQIFISYSHRDHDFAERLVKDLKAAGFSVWWDELEIKVGHSIIRKVFGEGIRKATYLAVVLSPNSIKSRFVQRELETALMSQLSSKNITVLPLLIKECKIPDFLKVIKWADFRSDYVSGFAELLQAIGQKED